jgi:hypothetical protein
MEAPLGFLLDPLSSHDAAHAAAAAVDARRAAARRQRVRARGVVFLTDAPISDTWLDGRTDRFEQCGTVPPAAATREPVVRLPGARSAAARGGEDSDEAVRDGAPSASVVMDTMSFERKRKPALMPDSRPQSVHFANRRDDILNSVFYEVKLLGLQGGGRLPVLPSLRSSGSVPDLARRDVFDCLGRDERERVAAAILAVGMGRNETIEVADGGGGTRRVQLSHSLPSLSKLTSATGEGRPETGEAREGRASGAAYEWQSIINEADGPADAGEPEDGLLDGPSSPGLQEWDLSMDQLQPEPPLPVSGKKGRKGKGDKGKRKSRERRGESTRLAGTNHGDIIVGSSSTLSSNIARSRSSGDVAILVSSASRGADSEGAGASDQNEHHRLPSQQDGVAMAGMSAPVPEGGAEQAQRRGGDVNEKARYLAEHRAKQRERAQLERVIRKHANEETLEARRIRADRTRAEREHRWEQRRTIHQAHTVVQRQARDVVVRRVHETRLEGKRRREAEEQRARERTAACRAREAAGLARTLARLPRAELLADGSDAPAGLRPAFPGTGLRRSTLGGGFQPSSTTGKGWSSKSSNAEAEDPRDPRPEQ